MKPAAHAIKIKESRESLEDAIAKGIAERQVTIGFLSSFLACNLFELFLHRARLIDYGTHFKHTWFASKRRLREALPFEFPHKQEILDLMHHIEKARDLLCYGNPQPESMVREQVERVRELERLIQEAHADEP
jgi:hypothetical protein